MTLTRATQDNLLSSLWEMEKEIAILDGELMYLISNPYSSRLYSHTVTDVLMDMHRLDKQANAIHDVLSCHIGTH